MTDYQGSELELFEQAIIWKKYFGSFIKPYLKGKILEVGAGIGGTTKVLCDGTQESWLCVEPDPAQSAKIDALIDSGELPRCCNSFTGTLEQLDSNNKYDAVLYIDVIEHIEDDSEEIRRAMGFLKPGGVLIILVPAYQQLYNSFDKAIGHYRRYNKSRLRAAIPGGLSEKRVFYLDIMGVLASVANKFLLKKSYPSEKDVIFWDRTLVKISKVLDFPLGYLAGKSLVGIWKLDDHQK